jgi:hypothetical protein
VFSPRSRSASRQSRGEACSQERGRPLLRSSARAISRAGPGGALPGRRLGLLRPVGEGRASPGRAAEGKASRLRTRDGGRLPLLPCLLRPERRTGASPPGRPGLRLRDHERTPLRSHCGNRPGAQKRMGDVRGPGGQPEPKRPARLVRAGIAHPNLADPTEFATLATFPLEARPGRCTQFPTGALADLGPHTHPPPAGALRRPDRLPLASQELRDSRTAIRARPPTA